MTIHAMNEHGERDDKIWRDATLANPLKTSYCIVEISAWILDVACCKFSSKFPSLHLTVWTICSKSEATPSIYWSLGKSPIFFLWHFGLSDFVSVIIRVIIFPSWNGTLHHQCLMKVWKDHGCHQSWYCTKE